MYDLGHASVAGSLARGCRKICPGLLLRCEDRILPASRGLFADRSVTGDTQANPGKLRLRRHAEEDLRRYTG